MITFPAPPVASPFLVDDGQGNLIITRPWTQWLQAVSVQLSAAGPVTGSKGGNAALANLISVLKAKGIIGDQTT